MGDVGIASEEIEEFLECLGRRGCGSYTASYTASRQR
jgi:hypothetical protein